MSNKKALPLLLTCMLFAVTPLYAFAEDSASPSGKEPMERMVTGTMKDKMPFLQPSGKPVLTVTSARGFGSMEERMKTLDTRIKLKEQTFKVRLTKLHDENKRTALLKLDTKISSISGRATIVMTNAIEKMTNILNKVEEKEMVAKDQGINTTSLDAAIADAKAALASASAAVTAQSNKVYDIPVTTDEAAKTSAGQTVSQMQNDLRQTYQSVMKAKQAVMKAITELKKIWKDVKPVNGTPTMSVTEMPLPTTTATPAVTVAPTDMEMSPSEMEQMNQ